MKQQIESNKAPKAIGPYSQAIKSQGFLFISGQIPLDPSSGEMPEGIEAQTKQVMQNINAILSEAGLGMQDIVKTSILLTDIGQFAIINEIYGSYFQAPYPARATYEVSALPKGAMIEIEATAQYQKD